MRLQVQPNPWLKHASGGWRRVVHEVFVVRFLFGVFGGPSVFDFRNLRFKVGFCRLVAFPD